MRLDKGSGSHFPSCAHCSDLDDQGRAGLYETALLEPLELLFSVGSYEWLSSVACARDARCLQKANALNTTS